MLSQDAPAGWHAAKTKVTSVIRPRDELEPCTVCNLYRPWYRPVVVGHQGRFDKKNSKSSLHKPEDGHALVAVGNFVPNLVSYCQK
jgi:hypothetical protein